MSVVSSATGSVQTASQIVPLPMPMMMDSTGTGQMIGGSGSIIHNQPSHASDSNEVMAAEVGEEAIYAKKRKEMMTMMGGADIARAMTSPVRDRPIVASTPVSQSVLPHYYPGSTSTVASNRHVQENMNLSSTVNNLQLEIADKDRVIKSMEAALGYMREQLVLKDSEITSLIDETHTLNSQLSKYQHTVDQRHLITTVDSVMKQLDGLRQLAATAPTPQSPRSPWQGALHNTLHGSVL